MTLRSTTLTILAILVAGFLVGWLSTSFARGGAQPVTQQWRAPLVPPNITEQAQAMAQDLRQSGHFGAVKSTDSIEAQPEVEKITPFPQIIATAQLDGEMAVALRYEDGTITSARAGDTVSDAWLVKEVSMQAVTVEHDGAITEFVVFPTPEVVNPDTDNFPTP